MSRMCRSQYEIAVNDVKRFRVDLSERKRAENYTNALKSVIQSIVWLNVWLSKLGIPVEFDASHLQEQLGDSVASKSSHYRKCTYDWDGSVVGYLRESHTRTVVDAIKKYVDRKDMSSITLILIGSMQLGKTMVFSALWLFLPVVMYVLSNGRVKTLSLLNLPGRHTLHRQAKEELHSIRHLYEDVIIRNLKTGYEKRIADYFAEQVRSVETGRMDLNIDQQWWNELILFRSNNEKSKQIFRDKVARFEAAGFRNISFGDESQYGTARGGVWDRWEDSITVDKICITATPSEQTSEGTEQQWKPVLMWIDKTYVGPRRNSGYDLPLMPGCKPDEILPDYHCIEDYLAAHDFPRDLIQVLIEPRAFEDYTEYVKRVKSTGTHADYARFQEKFTEAFVGLVSLLATPDRQMFFRIFKGNDATNDLLARAERLMSKKGVELPHVLKFYDKIDNDITIRELARTTPLTQAGMIVATARSRMGDSFPPTCDVFVDFTACGSSVNAVMQGTFGRGCGHKTPPLMLFMSDFYNNLEKLRKNNWDCIDEQGKRLLKIPVCQRTMANVKSGRPNCTFDLLFRDFEDKPFLMNLQQKLNAWVRKYPFFQGKPNNNVDSERSQIDRAGREVLSTEILQALPQHLSDNRQHFDFLTWGEVDYEFDGIHEKPACYMALACDGGFYNGQKLPKPRYGVIGRRFFDEDREYTAARPRRLLRKPQQRVEVQILMTVDMNDSTTAAYQEFNRLKKLAVEESIKKCGKPDLHKGKLHSKLQNSPYWSQMMLTVVGLSLRLKGSYKPKQAGRPTKVRPNSMRSADKSPVPDRKLKKKLGPTVYTVPGAGRRQCPHCQNYLSVRMKQCPCGYTFPPKDEVGLKVFAAPAPGRKKCPSCSIFVGSRTITCRCNHIF